MDVVRRCSDKNSEFECPFVYVFTQTRLEGLTEELKKLKKDVEDLYPWFT